MKLNAIERDAPGDLVRSSGTMHPFAPVDQAQGYAEMLERLSQSLESWLAEITGFDGDLPAAERGLPGRVRGHCCRSSAYHRAPW